MSKNNISKLFVFFFLITAIFSITFFLKQTQFLGKLAEEKAAAVTFDILPQGKLNRIWPYFSQGGEEQKPMLSPAFSIIRSLQPHYIRIDHLFDFPDLDQRIDEISQTGAKPFLALSYFPPSISSDLTTLPPDLKDWQALVQKIIQKSSGKSFKNLSDVYYEVWNEPDLFGKMTPEQYFNLYRACVSAASACQNCNPFKIGGPAITTLKKDWMDKFLELAGKNEMRLDFISWHSYQANPEKTLSEIKDLKNLGSFKHYFPAAELIISEWGSVPEVSTLHDSYFDASHTIAAIGKLKNSISKLFTFELVDGLDPEGKKFWGRWGLITNQEHGLTPKPRYYPFLYLGKLLEFELRPQDISPNVTTIGSTDGKENFSFILARGKGKEKLLNLELNLATPPPGIYQVNTYFLDPLHQPLIPESRTISVNENLTINTSLVTNAVVLLEINRASPALIIAKGRTDLPQDSSAKLTASTPPLIFLLNQTPTEQAEISFWFKPKWDTQENQKYIFLESKTLVGDGISAWYENTNNPKIVLNFTKYGETAGEVTLPASFSDDENWHKISLYFNNSQKNLGVMFDDQQSSAQINSRITLGDFVSVGGSQKENNSAEGFIDDLSITVNQETIYEKNFN